MRIRIPESLSNQREFPITADSLSVFGRMSEEIWLLLEALWTQPWWTYDPAQATLWDHSYRNFNHFEGFVWTVFAILVLRRWQTHHRSRWELVYAAAFLLFGLTDFREAFVQSAPLVLLKVVVLGVLWWSRRVVTRLYEGRFWW